MFKSLSVRANRAFSDPKELYNEDFQNQFNGEDQKQLELDENIVMMIRDQERRANVKQRIEQYRDLIDSSDFPYKMKTMVLRNSNRHRIKNLNNF